MKWGDIKVGDVLHYESRDPNSYLVLSVTLVAGMMSGNDTTSLDLLNLDDGELYDSWHVSTNVEMRSADHVHVELAAEGK